MQEILPHILQLTFCWSLILHSVYTSGNTIGFREFTVRKKNFLLLRSLPLFLLDHAIFFVHLPPAQDNSSRMHQFRGLIFKHIFTGKRHSLSSPWFGTRTLPGWQGPGVSAIRKQYKAHLLSGVWVDARFTFRGKLLARILHFNAMRYIKHYTENIKEAIRRNACSSPVWCIDSI